ncbi:hypothetical protein M3221_23605 [Domibacillus indicus]|uniref:hypothetical protein n=1 Tax=Domibacillus indicus TaxID=1437523 RepID=UPI0020414392|nr:hypothetical protein [Domibacillus indicus]MCM3791323.1 hypothetical protein [Domibacillus indicus]
MAHNNIVNSLDIQNKKLDHKSLIPTPNGFVFKFIKKDNDFVYTFIKGEFLKKVGLSPACIVGKTLHELSREDKANEKYHFYETAWNGSIINYEENVNGFHYLALLIPVMADSQVIEVTGTAIETTEHQKSALKIQELEKLSFGVAKQWLSHGYSGKH